MTIAPARQSLNFLVVFAGVCCQPEQAEAYHGHLAAEPGQVDRFPIKVSQR